MMELQLRHRQIYNGLHKYGYKTNLQYKGGFHFSSPANYSPQLFIF